MNTNIEIIDNGLVGTVLLNGKDISEEVSRIEYVHEGGRVAETKLVFIGQDVKICAPLCDTKLLPKETFSALKDRQIEELLMENPDLANSIRQYFEKNKVSSVIY